MYTFTELNNKNLGVKKFDVIMTALFNTMKKYNLSKNSPVCDVITYATNEIFDQYGNILEVII